MSANDRPELTDAAKALMAKMTNEFMAEFEAGQWIPSADAGNVLKELEKEFRKLQEKNPSFKFTIAPAPDTIPGDYIALITTNIPYRPQDQRKDKGGANEFCQMGVTVGAYIVLDPSDKDLKMPLKPAPVFFIEQAVSHMKSAIATANHPDYKVYPTYQFGDGVGRNNPDLPRGKGPPQNKPS